MLQRATQAAVTALWSTFQQLKFGSSKTVPKDGTPPGTPWQPQFGLILVFCSDRARSHEPLRPARAQDGGAGEAGDSVVVANSDTISK
jgi:hypothetical protein